MHLVHRLSLAVLALLLGACETEPWDSGEVLSTHQALSSLDCTASQETGYTAGTPFAITVITVDGKKVEQATANAYYVMAEAAAADGVTLKVVSGFRTMAEQTYLYSCYTTCSCNDCNLAAKPGFSAHQSGHALDLNTSATGVLSWLNAQGASFGFKRTVSSEPWHWEWWSGGPGGGPCGAASPTQPPAEPPTSPQPPEDPPTGPPPPEDPPTGPQPPDEPPTGPQPSNPPAPSPRPGGSQPPANEPPAAAVIMGGCSLLSVGRVHGTLPALLVLLALVVCVRSWRSPRAPRR